MDVVRDRHRRHWLSTASNKRIQQTRQALDLVDGIGAQLKRKCVRPIGGTSVDAGSVAAVIFTVVAVVAAGFQVALTLGAPWGSYAMGGRFPGRFPAPMRFAAVVQGAVLLLLAAVVLARAGLAFGGWASAASWLIWVVVGFSALSLLMNSISSSKGERMLWVPAAVLMLASSLTVALLG